MWNKVKKVSSEVWMVLVIGILLIFGKNGAKKDVKKKINKSVSTAVTRSESSRAKRIKDPLRKNNK